MVVQGKKIAIIGGGPGGLLVARLLQLQGAELRVYERDVSRDVRVQGATLDLHEESGLAAIRRAQLLPAFEAHYRPEAGKMRILDHTGNMYLDDHTAERGVADHRPEIDRAPLRNILLESLLPDTVVWDRPFVSMEPQNEGWLIHFKNGTSAYADLVIAADGANSKIRPYATDIKATYSGVTIVEGNIPDAEKNAPNLWKLVNGGKVFAFGNEQSIILSAKGEGSLSFYTGCKVAENWVQQSGIDFTQHQSVTDWFNATFRTWDHSWQELVASDETWFIARPQYHYALDQHWTTRPNLTLLGDAAHRMPPYAGEGVNMAMQDAVELAECLTTGAYTDLQSALSSYEAQMLKRASAVTNLTMEMTTLMHTGNPIPALVAMMTGQDN